MILADDLKKSIYQSAMMGQLTVRNNEGESIEDTLKKIVEYRDIAIKSKEMKQDKTLFPDITEEYPFDIPETWRWVTLGSLCKKIGAGSTPTGGKAVYVDSGIKFIREQNVYNDGLVLDDVAYITKEIHDSMKSSQVQANDILMNITGASIGRNSLVHSDFDTANINQHVLIIRLVDIRMKEYIHECLCSPFIYMQMMQNQKGDKPGLSAQRVGSFLIPLPPLAEQKNIIDKLHEIQPYIEDFRKAENDLEELSVKFPNTFRTSILNAAMTGKITSSCEGDSDVDTFLNLLPCYKNLMQNNNDMQYEIPETWKWVKLCELAATDDTDSFADGPFGSNLKKEHQISKPEVRIIQLSNIGENGWRDENTKYTSFEHLETIARCEVKAGDFVIAKMMPAGRCIEVPELGTKVCLGSDAIKFVPCEKLNKDFLLYAMKSNIFLKQVYGEVHGQSRIRTSLSKLKSYVIPFPPIEEQQRIVDKLNEILPLCDDLKI